MKGLTQAASARQPNCTSVMLIPTCHHCAEFLPSERTPSVGICLLHADRVLAQDKACSQYYQTEQYDQTEAHQPVGSDDEF